MPDRAIVALAASVIGRLADCLIGRTAGRTGHYRRRRHSEDKPTAIRSSGRSGGRGPCCRGYRPIGRLADRAIDREYRGYYRCCYRGLQRRQRRRHHRRQYRRFY